MATAAPTDDEETAIQKCFRYVCPICLESVKTPRSLPCLHTFCEVCLHTFITAAAGKGSGDIICPVCRKLIAAPELGLPHEKWATSFPMNYYLSMPFMAPDSQHVINEMEHCRICERMNKLVQAEHYCKTCAEAICDVCKTLHQNVQSLKKHAILTLESFRNNPSIPEIDEMCQYHPSKVVEVYCLDHSKMCCSVCFATKHRQCNDVKSIEECAKEFSEDAFKDISSKLDGLMKSLEQEIEGKEKASKKLKESRNEAKVKMTKCVQAAKKNLDILLEKFESDIDSQYTTDDRKLQKILKFLQGIKTSVIGDMQMLQTAYKYGSKEQVFVACERFRIQIGEQLKQISEEESGSQTESYSIESSRVEEICRLEVLSSFQTVPSRCNAVSEAITNKLTGFINADISRKQLHVEPNNIMLTEKWNYQWPSCYGATFVGSKVVVVSSLQDVVIIKDDGTLQSKHKIPHNKNPADIKSTGDENKFFISFWGQMILKEYHIDDNMIRELSQITLQGIAEGFCIFDDQIVHASNTAICISDKNGNLRQSIPTNSKGDIAFLAGCPKERMYYHIDGYYVCCRKLDEENVTKIPLMNHTVEPRGIGVDCQGNVYVCCFDTNSNKLLQISHKDKSVNVKIYVKCYSINFHPNGLSFLLTSLNDKKLRFYTLSD